MKHILLRSALALTLAAPMAQFSMAQEPAAPPPPPSDTQGPPPGGPMHRHPPDPHREATMLGRRLNLTPDQTTRIEPMLADRQSRMEALRSNNSLDQKARHEQARSIQEDTQTKLATVLTPDQLTQLKGMRERMGGRRGHGGPDGPGGNDAPPPPPPPTR